MARFLRRLSGGLLLLTNAVCAAAYLAACRMPGLDPGDWPNAGFLSLVLPYLLAGLILHGLLWLLVRPIIFLPNLLLLVLTYGSVRQVIPVHPGAGFGAKREASLRVMTWNLRSFTPFDKEFSEDGRNTRQHGLIFDEVARFDPDIVCFQEFTDAAKLSGQDPVRLLRGKLGYRYGFFPGDDFFKGEVLSGTAIFSKYRILRAAQVRYPVDRFYDNEHTLWADILYHGDTVRVHVMHLQSYRFLPTDYRTLGKMRNDSETGQKGTRLLYRKLRRTFIDHGEQSRWLRHIVDSSRHPYIVCTDLNNVPGSYAYRTLLGEGRDAFAEKGSGFGRTYISPQSRWMGILPTLRIDYILTDPRMETEQVTRGKARLSDHRAVVADLRLPQKE
jgi:endonuclease/exonuclease/phosphatase family metal-dependent hydrolase